MSQSDSLSSLNTSGQQLAPSNIKNNVRPPADASDKLAKTREATRVELSQQSRDLKVTQKRSAEHFSGLNEELSDAIALLNESLAKAPTKASISHDDELNRFVVRIADKESGEIVREIPSEDLLNFARYLDKLRGILFDKTI